MDRIVQLRNWLLCGMVGLVLAAIPIANRLTFDQTIESFFSPDNEDILILKRSREDFGGDEFVIVAWHEPGLIQIHPEREYAELSPGAAERIEAMASALSEVPGVDSQRTRDLQRILKKTPLNRNTRRAMLKLFEGLLLNAKQETTAVVLQLLPDQASSGTRAETIHEIRRVASKLNPQASVAGEAVQIQDMFDLVERDGHRLYIASVIVLSLVLLLIFRNVRWVLASMGIVLASVVLTRAAFVVFGAKLSMVSSMLNSLVTIISIGTTTHILVHYRELRSRLTAEQATVQCLRDLWRPVFWTVTTIAVGFAALLCSDIVPVRSFASMMTLGTMMVLLVTLAILPAAFASGNHIPVPGRVRLEDQLDMGLDHMAALIDRRPAATTVVCVLLTVIATPGLFVMNVETDFSKNFRDSSPIVQSLRFVESRLGPAGSWDVSFDAPQPLTSRFLDDLRELTDNLKALEQEGIHLDVLSLSDAIDIPPRLGSAVARLNKVKARQRDLVNGFYNEERRRMRIVLRSPEQQTTEAKLAQIEQIRQVVSRHFTAVHDRDQKFAAENDTDPPADESSASVEVSPLNQATASGLFVLMARVIDSLLADQLASFLWACAGTFLCMTIAFRSIRIGWISLVPNVFPIALVTGGMGLLQIPVNIGTAMIASVSMGFTCSVHYIEAFEKALPQFGMTRALQMAQASAGKAVVLAHIALVAGFMVLTVSEFIPLVYFGAILSLSMIGGLISDLVLLPLLLRWTTPVPKMTEPAPPAE
jgi:predicted RND superfamily exporter protein